MAGISAVQLQSRCSPPPSRFLLTTMQCNALAPHLCICAVPCISTTIHVHSVLWLVGTWVLAARCTWERVPHVVWSQMWRWGATWVKSRCVETIPPMWPDNNLFHIVQTICSSQCRYIWSSNNLFLCNVVNFSSLFVAASKLTLLICSISHVWPSNQFHTIIVSWNVLQPTPLHCAVSSNSKLEIWRFFLSFWKWMNWNVRLRILPSIPK